MSAIGTDYPRLRWVIQQLVLSLLAAAFLLLSHPVSAQLPGTAKPQEFEPTVPDFNKLSADWWTNWPDVTLEERQQWLEEVEKAWLEWSKTLPQEEGMDKRISTVNLRFDGIRKVWENREKLKKVDLLKGVTFPSAPTVLQWAEADAGVARGRQRASGLQLEVAQLNEIVPRSLSRLREQVVQLRETAKNDADHISGTVALFLAQLRHLQVLAEHHTMTSQLATWEEELGHGDSELTRMLGELQYSEEVTEQLQEAVKEVEASLEKLARERGVSQSIIVETSDTSINVDEQIKLMEVSVASLKYRLQSRKQEILLAMNQVLAPDGEKTELSVKKDLITKAQAVRETLARQLNVRQRQIMAWRAGGDKDKDGSDPAGGAGEEGTSLTKWWREFEKIDNGLNQVGDLIKDVQRYENAQLYVYKRQQGYWRTLGERLSHQLANLKTGWRNLANYKLFTVSEQPITLRDIAQMILVIIAAWFVSRLVAWFLRRMMRRKRASEHVAYNVERVINYCIVLITIMIILSMVGLDTSKLTLIAGALSVGLGFGMQAIFSNFISGIILLFEQPLRVGDLVELESGVFGRIRDINVRSTRITTRDNVDILVPNSEFVTGRVTNHTLEDPVRRIHIPFGVAYGTDPELVREAAMAAAEAVPVTFSNWQRKSEVWLTGFGDSSLDFKLVVWVNSNAMTSLGDLAALYNLELLRELSERNIEIPFPQRDLHLRSWGEAAPAVPQPPDREAAQTGPARDPVPERRGSAGVEDWHTGDADAEGDGGDGGDGGPSGH
ncbi:mechanosensitive ion channel domain-containing protein [uncultured Microbulbifer sp.]|uniref:mechanosensitive ion channel family protein n=1 Tax=uncultured Microbulbifer sp. TaxID=348147 RepID=UPI0025E2E223|nr:mechanosensitive ion channel domain-containing protein [uncultured Microbulbifer sp.]